MKNNYKVLEYLSSLDKRIPSPGNIISWSLFSLVITLFIAHLLFIMAEHPAFLAYKEDYYSKAERVFFHLLKGTELSQTVHGTQMCSPEDLAWLQEIKDNYYFIGDLARVKNKQIICSVRHGIYPSPQPMPEMRYNPANHFLYGNPHNSVFIDESQKPVIGLNNTLAYVSDIFLKEIHQSGPRRTGRGVIIHTQHSLTPLWETTPVPFILRFNGFILPKDIQPVLNHHNTLSDYLPLPGKIRTSRQCNVLLDFCVTTVVTELGLYNKGPVTLFFLCLSGIIAGVLISYQLHFYTTGPRTFIRRLRHAIRKNKIVAVYQPQVDLTTMKVCGFEALARWYDDKYQRQIPPDIFIPVAENEGLIEPMTRSFIHRTLEETHQLLNKNPQMRLSINVPPDVLIKPDFLHFLQSQVATYQLEPSQIILEVTERHAGNNQAMSQTAQLVSDIGFLISLDDFGTGHSNLEWLTMLNPHEIKIDKIFTQSIETNSLGNMTLNGIFHMLEHLDVHIVFEGIETKQQLTYICRKVPEAIGQGWLFSKPVSHDELTQQIEKIHTSWAGGSGSTVVPFTK